MPLEQIISIVAFFLVLVLIWGAFKKIFKLMFYAGIIISLLLAANLYFIYQDFRDLRENLGVSGRKVILKDGDVILTGLLINEETSLMTTEQLSDYSSYLKGNDYEKILGDSYKLMVFDVGIISNLDDKIEIENRIFTKDQLIAKLRSGSNYEKASLFSVILADEILSPKNPLLFFSEYKAGNIIIYPETALFKTVKIIPIDAFKDAAKSLFAKTKEKAKTFIVDEAEQ